MRKTALITITGLAVLTFLGCAAMRRSEAEQTDRLLAAAGFKILPADTPQKLEMIESLPPLKLQYRVKDGTPLYFFADPYDCKCIYTGDQAAYDRFQRLAEQARIAEEEQQAALMNEEAAMEFSPFGWGWMGGPWGL
ncbi:hypothetical protein MYX76_04675 [Desulfobacterota bacterium AH_259_B03_O07]|nr:hypothetical protein [Desulfobacterota bacterium AH_259_B03_O07]